MRFHVLTLFPELIEGSFATSITGRALEKGQISLMTVNIRDYAGNKHQKVDDYPYGGGAGMVMQAEPVYAAYEELKKQLSGKQRVIYVTPQGRVFDQELAQELALEEELVFLCGHYEGIDERVLDEIVTDYISIGDYVLTGGELPALVMMDAVSRLVPGVLNNDISAEFESFHANLLEYPQYSRPEVWHGRKVPEELLSGNHKRIDAWRLEQSVQRTKIRRPDLYQRYMERVSCEEQLLKSKLNHMDMLENLRQDKSKILLFTENEIVLYDKTTEIIQITSSNYEDKINLLQKVKEKIVSGGMNSTRGIKKLILHQEAFIEEAMDIFGMSKVTKYQQWVYTLKNPLPLRYDAQVVSSKDGMTKEAYSGNELVGFMRRNQAGVLKDLSISENWCDRGIEQLLETAWINSLLEKGRTPIFWVAEDNLNFQQIQKELNLYKSKNPIWVLEV